MNGKRRQAAGLAGLGSTVHRASRGRDGVVPQRKAVVKGGFTAAGSTLAVSSVGPMDAAAQSHRTDFAVTADATAGLI